MIFYLHYDKNDYTIIMAKGEKNDQSGMIFERSKPDVSFTSKFAQS